MMGPKLKKSGQNNVNNKIVEHPQQQPKPNTMPRVPNNSQNAILHQPSPSRFQTNEKPKFVGSLSILHAVVDAINTRIFCKNLDDIELEWCDKLTERKAVTYKVISLTTTKTYIRLSKILFENASRKQLVETVMYELLQFYLSSQSRTNDENDLQVYLLNCGIRYLNEAFELALKINHNFDSIRYGVKKENNVPSSAFNNNNDANESPHLIELLGGSTVEFIPVSSKRNPIVRIINKKLIVKNQEQFKCKINCDICHCGPQLIMRERYLGAKIYAFFTIRPDTFDCILCECEVERRKLNKHFDNDCVVFKVSQVIHDKLNV